jgi:serine-type D-Ala-D-Ala carboxypeptidase (penicillin-binding protein 5/6)
MLTFFRMVFFGFFLFSTSSLIARSLEVTVDAKTAILINADNGKILFEKDANSPAYPASLTKIATALFILEKHPDKLDEILTVSREALKSVNSEEKRRSEYAVCAYYLEEGSSNIALVRGEKESLRSLLSGMLIASGNDAANVVAEGVSGTIPSFMQQMGDYLKELGFEKSCFKNPHGVHHPSHVTTAYEMAELTRRAMRLEDFQKMVSSLSYSHGSRSFAQTNRLMKRGKFFYPYAIGVKTGYTSQANYNLVAAAEKEGRKLIAVLMGCSENLKRYEDARHLFDAAFREKKLQKRLLRPQTFQVKIEGAKTLLEAPLEQEILIEYYPSEEDAVELFMHWKNLELPIAKGSQVAAIEVYSSKKKLLFQVPLYAKEAVTPTLFYGWKRFFSHLFGGADQKAERIPSL